jgi:hypothetical protein
MMRGIGFILLLGICGSISAQGVNGHLEKRMMQLHQLMTGPNTVIDQYLHEDLSYGHSNGWIENKREFIAHLGNRLVYHSFKEDSVHVTVNKQAAHIRFIGDIDVTMDGKRALYHLKVLEIWLKSGKQWRLFARQAVK